MKKMVLLLFLISIVLAQETGIKKPYEATWLKIIKMNNSYVVLSYPSLHSSLLDEGKTRTQFICKVKGDSMTWITFSDEPMKFKLNNVVKLSDNSYRFNFKDDTNFRFDYIDKVNHIAKWSIYYSDGRFRDSDLYIDSLYNTFPIVDIEIKFDGSDDE
ncbi:MAG: hypothetical protein LBH25_14735 [Fibromonadaceae bacterium]|jgi:hypothetical protein|nr:hypothetical protein [Fibromonadaceae bacterium]